MYKVTELRLKKALPILERYRSDLHRSGDINALMFEKELRECWNVGYKSMKDLAIDLSKNERYLFLAVYYMENSNGGRNRVVGEFKSVLGKLYGIKYYNHSPERVVAQDKFWASMPKDK